MWELANRCPSAALLLNSSGKQDGNGPVAARLASMAELNGVPITTGQLQALALTNYGHFTSMLVDGGKVRGLSLHLDRLVHDCRRVFDADLDPERIRELVQQALGDVAGALVVRVTVFDPDLELGHPGSDAHPYVLVTTRSAPTQSPPPLRVQTAEYVREMPDVKHVGLFGTIRLRRAAQRAGFDDVLFADTAGEISEGATWNIGFATGEGIVWPDAECLPGVTMALLNQAPEVTSVRRPINVADLPQMRAAFVTNAAVGVRPIAAIDDTGWPDVDPFLEDLRKVYADIPAETI